MAAKEKLAEQDIAEKLGA